MLVLLSLHIYPAYQVYTRNSLLHSTAQDTTIKIPWRISQKQKAYLTYLQQNTEEAISLWKEIASWSVENQYNLWTYLAMRSVASGEITNLAYLQEAETYLSGAATLDVNNSIELAHNLQTVRDLLKKDEEQQQEQQSDPQNWSWDQQQNQEQQSWADEQEQWEKNQWSAWSTPQLSESMKQQLEQYQKQLAEAQEQNQQFFDKPQQTQAQNDPFNALNQLFGGTPQLEQQQNNWTKDW